MTTPEIKRYRRKVSEERVAEVKKRFDQGDILDVMICPLVVRGVLEADAEVIEGDFRVVGDEMVECVNGFIAESVPLKKFHAEWEEITG